MPIKLPVRYLAMQSTGPDDNVESNITTVETIFELELKETALVMVDTWNKHHVKSHKERTAQIMQEKIAPVIKAARAAGLTIIHGPSPRIAREYPQWVRYAGDSEFFNRPSGPAPDWPPAEFLRKEAAYAKYKRLPGETPPDYDGPYPDWWRMDAIHPAVEPEPEDFVVATGDQLHRLLRDRKILHLVYTGFATNICVTYRDYGVRAMGDRGYTIILLRNCTTGIETRESMVDFSTTKWAIQEIERRHFSATSEDFIKACG